MEKSLKLLCGDAKLGSEIENGLTLRGMSITPDARYVLLVDALWGWVQSQLADTDINRTVALSNNPCPEYKLDLLRNRPAALFTDMSLAEITEGLEEVWRAQYPELQIHLPLTSIERLTLHLIVKGHTPKGIANVRNISEGRVKNTLGTIYQSSGSVPQRS